MMMQSMHIWESFARELGEDVGFVRGGCMVVADTEDSLSEISGWLTTAKDYGLDTRLIDGKELDTLVDGGSKNWVGALYTASDARAEPHKATPAIARAASRHGASILTSCAVRGIERSAGSVSAVVTEHGVIRTSRVLCAAGAWTSMFCRSLGISLPQLQVIGTVARLSAGPDVMNGNVYDKHLGIRRRDDGGYTVAHGFTLDHPITPSSFRYGLKFLPALRLEFEKLKLSFGSEFFDQLLTPTRWDLDTVSPFEKRRILNPAPRERELLAARKEIARLFPALADVPIEESWAGVVETTPDVVPVMCESDTIPGFFIASGFSGHGFGIGPGAGKAASEMLTNASGGVDLSEFRLSRFFDGSPIRPQSSV